MICKNVKECVNTNLSKQPGVCVSGQNCIEFCDERIEAVCQEKHKKYSLVNSKLVKKRATILSIKVDDGIVVVDRHTPASLCKCDFMFCVRRNDKQVAILVELKGKHIKHAIEQIENTLILLKDSLSECSAVHGRIIYGGSAPRITTTPDFIRLQRKLKIMHGSLITYTTQLTEDLESILK